MIKSAKRALEILELFEKIRRPARVSEVSELLSYPQSSTSALMNSLRSLGYLVFNPEERTFSPSLRVSLLGGWLQFGQIGREQVFELLSSIEAKSAEATILSTPDGVNVQYIYTLDGPGPIVMRFKAGTLRPICRTAPGLVLLAHFSDAEIGRIVRRSNAEADEHGQVVLADVLKLVAQARVNGYLCLAGSFRADIGTVASRLPFVDMFGKPLAVSISGPVDRIVAREAELLHIIQQEISDFCSPRRPKARAAGSVGGGPDIKLCGS
jgi:DNA-binding IclR family transcriptional regulator